MGSEDGTVTILTLNVCSPSRPRAERQLDWLGERPEQVFVLTEIGVGQGSQMIADRLRGAGWTVRSATPGQGERGVMIASRLALGAERPSPTSYLPERTVEVTLGSLKLIGVYAPSRDESASKIARKRRFLAELLTTLAAREPTATVLIGDLNVVERSNRASDRTFQEWEYELYEDLPSIGWLDAYRALHPERVELSWTDTEGRGYRFDHCFTTGDLREYVRRCEYVHETRESELSDHSAMLLDLAIRAPKPLEVNSSLASGPPSLF
jgi:exodeoxyribonuclease-3